MSALRDTAVPVPHMVTLCEDPDVIGAPFYVMELVEGEVLRADADLAGRSREDRAELAHQLIDTLADLHSLDPKSLGLKDFGHPEGFLERQVRRWGQQLEIGRAHV